MKNWSRSSRYPSSTDISSATENELTFTITTSGNYVINFSDATTTDGYHEFLLLECRINNTNLTGIEQHSATTSATQSTAIYNTEGMKCHTLSHGVNIVRRADGKTIKILK